MLDKLRGFAILAGECGRFAPKNSITAPRDRGRSHVRKPCSGQPTTCAPSPRLGAGNYNFEIIPAVAHEATVPEAEAGRCNQDEL